MNENEIMESEPETEELEQIASQAAEDAKDTAESTGAKAKDDGVNAEAFGKMSELEKYYTLRRLGFSHDDACIVSGGALDSYRGKGHLKSAVPAAAKSPVSSMPARELAEARELFGDLTDAQIQNLYRKVTKN